MQKKFVEEKLGLKVEWDSSSTTDNDSENFIPTDLNKEDEFASKVAPIIMELTFQGISLNRIAERLNEKSILTARGKIGAWTPTAVKNALAMVEGSKGRDYMNKPC